MVRVGSDTRRDSESGEGTRPWGEGERERVCVRVLGSLIRRDTGSPGLGSVFIVKKLLHLPVRVAEQGQHSTFYQDEDHDKIKSD